MKIKLTTEGLLKPENLRRFTLERQRALHRAVAAGMAATGPAIAKSANEAAHRALKVRDTKFPSFKAKVFASNPDRLPVLQVASKVPWLGVHEKGAVIQGKLLIPFDGIRLGYKRWKAMVAALMRSGNAFFVKKNGKTILFAENIKENASQLNRFRRAERSRSGKNVKRGQEIPIATLVSSVNLKRRLNLDVVANRHLRELITRIEREVARV